MLRRTSICVWCSLALHGVALLALDRGWFSAATSRPPVVRDYVIELVPSVPEEAAKPVELAAVVSLPLVTPPAPPTQVFPPSAELEKLPEPKPELKPEPAVLPAPVTPAPKVVAAVVPTTSVASSGSTSATAPLSPVPVSTAVNSSSFAEARPATTPVVTSPAYLNNPEPTYPASARLRKQEGTVLLAVEVSPKGRALQVEVESSSGFSSLDDAALSNVRRWRFKPALLNGVPTGSRVHVPIRFRLEN